MSFWIDTRDDIPIVRAAFNLPRVTGSISFVCSSIIIYMMVSDRKWKLTKPNHRILLAMSIFDLIASTVEILSSVPVPSHLGVVGAIGNETTCNVQAFMFQLSTAVMLYNASLSYYYFMTVCRQVSKIEFAKKFQYEKICHIISIGYPLVTAIIR
ncbi:hypothetical protein CTEN210_09236 [Chaetoceros tenuissimus]|uniref:Uncharacterized protein n=1 Tax=Chaetoceros tenuissimus TaxID=426638 RepID=A0AAD3CX42_9STRA|nr:hypothetical protein CTEN210_09236 [Chaetoceros tenuissimus]